MSRHSDCLRVCPLSLATVKEKNYLTCLHIVALANWHCSDGTCPIPALLRSSFLYFPFIVFPVPVNSCRRTNRIQCGLFLVDCSGFVVRLILVNMRTLWFIMILTEDLFILASSSRLIEAHWSSFRVSEHCSFRVRTNVKHEDALLKSHEKPSPDVV